MLPAADTVDIQLHQDVALHQEVDGCNENGDQKEDRKRGRQWEKIK